MGKKPIIAIANSFDEFLPGHVHLNKVGRIVSEAIKEAGGIPREFNTMAVDDGIAMGHTGMLYSLPSRDIIADTVEYQCNAHCADALICIPNCDKVVPGMLMAALRLNIPTVFVSGGPMEAGTTVLADGTVKSTDLIDVMYATADDSVSDEELLNYEKTVCPTCGSCAGMFTANSMNCLTEAIGLALPGNGTILASHSYRKDLFKRAAQQVVKPGFLGLGKVRKHISRHPVLVSGMADSDAQPPVSLADMLVDRAQPVMPGMAAAGLEPHLARRKIQLVMKHDHRIGGQLQIAHRLADGLPRKIHEGARPQQRDTQIAQPPLGHLALKTGAPGAETVIGGDAIDGHIAHVMPVFCVFRPGIAKAHDQYHAFLRRWDTGYRLGGIGANFIPLLSLEAGVTKTLSTFGV